MAEETGKLRCSSLLQVIYRPFKVLGVDEAKKNYRLDISRSPFLNMYPMFHVNVLKLYYKLPKSLVPAPIEDKTIIPIYSYFWF